jgi:UDP-3-O-[3-hydroxymyristoyl] glucosamine N-acyltransferase
MRLDEIAGALGAAVHGDGSMNVTQAVHPLEAEADTDLALAMDKSLLPLLVDSPARSAILSAGMVPPESSLDGYITVGRSRYAMAGITSVFEKPVFAPSGIHSSAVVEESAKVAGDVRIGAFSYIGPDVVIGRGCTIMSHVTIGAGASVGRNVLFHPGVRIGERVTVGDRVIIHANASIGADGFSFVTPEPGSVESSKSKGRIDATNTEIVRVNSLGAVVLGDDTEIGACSSIDRGTISSTRIGRGTKLDDLVMVGHNVEIGENCMICGQVGIAGSSIIGDRVVLAGQVGVADHLKIGNDVVVGGGSGVGSNLSDREIYLGSPAIKKTAFVNQLLSLRRMETMFKELLDLKKRFSAIETAEKKR